MPSHPDRVRANQPEVNAEPLRLLSTRVMDLLCQMDVRRMFNPLRPVHVGETVAIAPKRLSPRFLVSADDLRVQRDDFGPADAD